MSSALANENKKLRQQLAQERRANAMNRLITIKYRNALLARVQMDMSAAALNSALASMIKSLTEKSNLTKSNPKSSV